MFNVHLSDKKLVLTFKFKHDVPFESILDENNKKVWVHKREENKFYGTQCFIKINNKFLKDKNGIFISGRSFLHSKDDFNFNRDLGRRIALKQLLKILQKGNFSLDLEQIGEIMRLLREKNNRKTIWKTYFYFTNQNNILLNLK